MKRLGQLLSSLRYERLPEKEKDDRETESGSPTKQQLGQTASRAQQHEDRTRWPVALLSVKGMTCAACSKAVEAALSSVEGVKRVSVALLQESAEVHFDESSISPEALVALVEDAGFDGALVSVRRPRHQMEVLRLRVSGMVCSACSGAVEAALREVPGVTRAGVALASGEAEVTFDAAVVTAESVVAAVEEAGFEAATLSQEGLETMTIRVEGMTGTSSSTAVEAALRRVPGVARAAVNLIAGQAEVWYDSNTSGPRDFLAAVNACAGGGVYTAHLARGLGAVAYLPAG
ncbi:hypothetical protein Agub_g5405, partial [Astrephomene gubernaculifera]